MTYKTYNRQVFTCNLQNKEYTFTCYTQNTSYGFRHICYAEYNDLPKQYVPKPTAKVSYYNRTWEHFKYETVLKQAIKKSVPKEHYQAVYDILIKGKAEEEQQAAEQFLTEFLAAYESSSNILKDKLKNVTIETEEQAKAVLNIMKFDNAMQQIGML